MEVELQSPAAVAAAAFPVEVHTGSVVRPAWVACLAALVVQSVAEVASCPAEEEASYLEEVASWSELA